MRTIKALVLASLMLLVASACQADDVDDKVCEAFAQQTLAFEQMLARVRQSRMTADDKEFLRMPEDKRFPGTPELVIRVRTHLTKLEQGQWSGPAPYLRAAELGVGSVGMLASSMRVFKIINEDTFIGDSTDSDDLKTYIVKGWKTADMVQLSNWGLSGMVVVTGTKTVAGIKCLVVESVHLHAPSVEKMKATKAELEKQQKAAAKKK